MVDTIPLKHYSLTIIINVLQQENHMNLNNPNI